MADHAMRMFRACEMAGASTTVRRSSIVAAFTCHKDPDGEYVMGFDVQKIRDSGEFREVRRINFPLERFSVRQRANKWRFLNSAALAG
jgi:hypothetical protein